MLAFKATTEVILITVWTTSSPQFGIITAVLIIAFTFLHVTEHSERIPDGCQHQTKHEQQSKPHKLGQK